MPGPSAAPTRAHRAWTVRTSRMSRRTACSGGSANWRLRSGRRRTDRTPSEECSYRRPIDGEEPQAQAVGHLDPARSGVHDSSDAGARADLRSRPSTRAVRLPAGPQCPAGGDRGGRDAVPRPSGSRRRRPRGLLRVHSTRRTDAVARAAHRGPACAASDQDVAGMRRGGNRRPRTEDTHDRGQGSAARHSARVSHLTAAGQSVHAPVRAGVEEVRAGARALALGS